MKSPSTLLVNDRALFRPGAGVSVYLENLLRHWPEESELLPRGVTTHFALRRDSWPQWPRPRFEEAQMRPLNTLEFPNTWRDLVPGWIRRIVNARDGRRFRSVAHVAGAAVAFEPNHLPHAWPGPTLTTMHDLSAIEHPEWHPHDRVRMWRGAIKTAVRETNHWMADSAFTRDRMIELLGITAASITVAHLAPKPWSVELDGVAPVLDQPPAALKGPYLLHLGTLEPRKNLGCLLRALACLTSEQRKEFSLVFAGGAGWGDQQYRTELIEHPMASNVLITGRVSDGFAQRLLRHASALVAPSHYEGFGLPLVEAMAEQVPLLCSDIPVFREVAADAALYIAANDDAGWGQAMLRIVQDSSLRSSLTEAGRARSKAFSWRTTASLTEQAARGLIGQ